MGRILAVAQRALLLAIIWGLAAVVLAKAVYSCVVHERLAREVAQLGRQYDKQFAEYGELLVEGEKLKQDDDYKVSLLKKRFGYTRPNETPIVVLRDDAAHGEGEDPQQRD
jgi:hypothetical protein